MLAKLSPSELNAAMNRFAREPEAKLIGSPYRVQEYCKLRLKGLSPQDALTKVRSVKASSTPAADMSDDELRSEYEKARVALESAKKARAPGPQIDALRKEWMKLQYWMKVRKMPVGKWLSQDVACGGDLQYRLEQAQKRTKYTLDIMRKYDPNFGGKKANADKAQKMNESSKPDPAQMALWMQDLGVVFAQLQDKRGDSSIGDPSRSGHIAADAWQVVKNLSKNVSASLVTQTSRKVRYLRQKYGPTPKCAPPEVGAELQHQSGRRVTLSARQGELFRLSDGRRLTLSKLSRDYSWRGKNVAASTISSAAEQLAPLGYKFKGGKQAPLGKPAQYVFVKGGKEVVLDSAQIKKLLKSAKASQDIKAAQSETGPVFDYLRKEGYRWSKKGDKYRIVNSSLSVDERSDQGADEKDEIRDMINKLGGKADWNNQFIDFTASQDIKAASGRRLRGHHSLLPGTTRNLPEDQRSKVPPMKTEVPTLQAITSLKVGDTKTFGPGADFRMLQVTRVTDSEWSTNYATSRNSNRLTAQQALAELMSRVKKDVSMSASRSKIKLPKGYTSKSEGGGLTKVLTAEGGLAAIVMRRNGQYVLERVYDQKLRNWKFSQEAEASEGESGKFNCDFPSEESARSFAAEAMKVPGAKVTCSGRNVSCTYPSAGGSSIMASAGKYHAAQATAPVGNSRAARYAASKSVGAMTVKASTLYPQMPSNLAEMSDSELDDAYMANRRAVTRATNNLGSSDSTTQRLIAQSKKFLAETQRRKSSVKASLVKKTGKDLKVGDEIDIGGGKTDKIDKIKKYPQRDGDDQYGITLYSGKVIVRNGDEEVDVVASLSSRSARYAASQAHINALR